MAEQPTFEQNLSQLETIVNQLEQGDVPLEQALDQFQKGVALSKQLQATLEGAEKTLTKMMNENGDEVVLKELDESDLEQGYGGGQPWHKDELKEAMEGDDAVSDSRNDMESHMNGAIENAGDDVASFNDTLEAEANAQAPVEAGFGETDLDTELGFTNDSQDD